MKTIKIFISAFVIMMSTQISLAQTQEVEIKTSAQCMECKENIEGTLIDLKGVKFVELDLDNNVVTVAYNAKKVTPDDIRKEITLIGYNADELEADAEAVQRLSPCCRPDGTHLHE